MRAILFVELDGSFPSAAEKVKHVSLGNCLQLVAQFSANELIVQVECDNPKSLNVAVNNDIAGIEGVKRIITCAVLSS